MVRIALASLLIVGPNAIFRIISELTLSAAATTQRGRWRTGSTCRILLRRNIGIRAANHLPHEEA
jgi:hypothetical protein